jgi:hypothetical protein
MNYYMTNFLLWHDLKAANVIDWDNIPPFERQIYLNLLQQRLDMDSKKNQPAAPFGTPPSRAEYEGRNARPTSGPEGPTGS